MLLDFDKFLQYINELFSGGTVSMVILFTISWTNVVSCIAIFEHDQNVCDLSD